MLWRLYQVVKYLCENRQVLCKMGLVRQLYWLRKRLRWYKQQSDQWILSLKKNKSNRRKHKPRNPKSANNTLSWCKLPMPQRGQNVCWLFCWVLPWRQCYMSTPAIKLYCSRWARFMYCLHPRMDSWKRGMCPATVRLVIMCYIQRGPDWMRFLPSEIIPWEWVLLWSQRILFEMDWEHRSLYIMLPRVRDKQGKQQGMCS